ncbi:unnamed protein product [Ilex paraguariensis]|uniref:Uncharacterized protein n=1 Tax=Ilex paraguariensis TaxID=185542 RepID=A0ABC8SZ75_9AQUA
MAVPLALRCFVLCSMLVLMLFVGVEAVVDENELQILSVKESQQLQDLNNSTMADRSNEYAGVSHEHAVDDPEVVASMVDIVKESQQLQDLNNSTMADRSNEYAGVSHEHAVDDPEVVASMVDM